MRHLDLFSGIGGFALATEMVWEDVEHIFCDNDPFCQAILKKHWPNSPIYGDIKKLSGKDITTGGGIDLLTGGFPCQPFSAAGKRKGTGDDRHLWPQMLRVIRECRPTYVLGENVGGLLTWDGGLVFEQVCTDLEGEGYEVGAFVIPAAAVGAPHRRDRVWIVAHANRHSDRRTARANARARTQEGIRQWDTVGKPGKPGTLRIFGDSEHAGLYGTENTESGGTRGHGDTQGSNQDGKPARPAVSRHEADGADSSIKGRTRSSQENSRRPRFADRHGIDQRRSWESDWSAVAAWHGRMDDGLSYWMDYALRRIEEINGTPYQQDKGQEMRTLRKRLQSKEVRDSFGGLYSIPDTQVLLRALCGIPRRGYEKWSYDSRSEMAERFLREMWDQREIGRPSPRWRDNEQLKKEHKDLLPFLSYETSLAVAEAWHCVRFALQNREDQEGYQLKSSRKLRLKGLGNAIVPQVAAEIMRSFILTTP